MQGTKPFFQALETVLKNRLPPDEFAQVMEESLWEYETGAMDPEGLQVRTAPVRLASICLSFYRAMTKMGMGKESALETIAQASTGLRGAALRGIAETGAACPVAGYFRAKGSLPLCRAVFCKACPGAGSGCAQAAAGSEDWRPAGNQD